MKAKNSGIFMADSDNAEAMACALEQHSDYRVLRRLKIKTQYGLDENRPAQYGLILDTETTGLDLKEDQVVELAMLMFEYDPVTGKAGRICEIFSELEQPRSPIPASATAIHGITNDMVSGKKFNDAEVSRLLTQASLVIAHNAEFDRPMVEKRFAQFAQIPWACSLKDIAWRDHGFVSGALEILGIGCGFFYDAHRAEMDCRAVLEVLQQTDKAGNFFLRLLIEKAQKPEYRIWALDAPFSNKDVLKSAGYKWRADNPKAWGKAVSKTDFSQEISWLYQDVYNHRTKKIRIDEIDPTGRFTDRITKIHEVECCDGEQLAGLLP
jgi:DNA polymerase-3 subunit epsilon